MEAMDETFPDIGAMSNEELKELISGADVEQSTEILAGRVTGKDPAA
jgi:hypothetical protein